MSKRRPLLAGNWKMYGTATEAGRLTGDLLERLRDVKDRDVLLAPPFAALPAVVQRLRLAGSAFFVAGQNLHWEDTGAFTGEISAPMLVDAGCSHVIVGHSERRQYFGDTDDWVARKVGAALGHNLTPILCVGETLTQREGGETLKVVARQLRTALQGLDARAIAAVVVAYEPVWAIGTGKVATPAEAQEVHASLRSLLAEGASSNVADGVRILYGGSVKPGNVDELMREPDIDGALVGGASLKADDFARIVGFGK